MNRRVPCQLAAPPPRDAPKPLSLPHLGRGKRRSPLLLEAGASGIGAHPCRVAAVSTSGPSAYVVGRARLVVLVRLKRGRRRPIAASRRSRDRLRARAGRRRAGAASMSCRRQGEVDAAIVREAGVMAVWQGGCTAVCPRWDDGFNDQRPGAMPGLGRPIGRLASDLLLGQRAGDALRGVGRHTDARLGSDLAAAVALTYSPWFFRTQCQESSSHRSVTHRRRSPSIVGRRPTDASTFSVEARLIVCHRSCRSPASTTMLPRVGRWSSKLIVSSLVERAGDRQSAASKSFAPSGRASPLPLNEPSGMTVTLKSCCPRRC